MPIFCTSSSWWGLIELMKPVLYIVSQQSFYSWLLMYGNPLKPLLLFLLFTHCHTNIPTLVGYSRAQTTPLYYIDQIVRKCLIWPLKPTLMLKPNMWPKQYNQARSGAKRQSVMLKAKLLLTMVSLRILWKSQLQVLDWWCCFDYYSVCLLRSCWQPWTVSKNCLFFSCLNNVWMCIQKEIQ